MKVAIIGTGVMGAPMVERLLAAKHEVHVFNRTRHKAAPLEALGATVCDSPALATADSDLVISMVTDGDALVEVALGDNGILPALRSDAVHCDMSTITPEDATRIHALYADASKRYVQAPVLGNKKHIADGKLLVFAGGADGDIDTCERALSAFACEVRRFPTPAQAAAAKLSCNMMIGQMILGLGQSLVFAKKSGLDPGIMLEIIMASNLAAPMYANKGKTIAARDFTPNFFVRHMLKDLDLAARSGDVAGIKQPMNEAARQLFQKAAASGLGDQDYSAVVKVLEELASVEIAS
ncbi:MAG TPA: NAD(P)-dependent oxidoreductase [Capsulimonadaceae bacterium]|jgi:3-hydroxyisobutyrate dehydrogenase-like beta-hydroxyacid dehydrogenase